MVFVILPRCLRAYLQIKHPYEVGALKVVFDEAEHPGLLHAPNVWAVRQSHEQLCHRSRHGLRADHTYGDNSEAQISLYCRLHDGLTSLSALFQ